MRTALGNQHLKEVLKKATQHSIERRGLLLAEENWEELRSSAHIVRKEVIDHLGDYLELFINSATRNGMQVEIARDAGEACRMVEELVRRKGGGLVVKGKSMVTEEIHLNSYLEGKDIEVLETDLGEFIIQLAEERPSHITAPAIHMSRQDVGRLFHEKLGLDYIDDPALLTAMIREYLRKKFLQARVGITGANFLLAREGAIVLLENEGNIRLSTSLPELHIVVTGIEKLLPSLESLPLFMKLLPASATGQRLTSYLNIIQKPGMDQGAKEIHLILLDNGRSSILSDRQLREILYCIRCGACMNICPIFQLVGGQTYGSVYPGPLGIVLSPALKNGHELGELPFASSLCGACTSVCPVKIPLHNLIAYSRNLSVLKGETSLLERLTSSLITTIFSYAKTYQLTGTIFRYLSRFLKVNDESIHLPRWSREREFPLPPLASFRTLWKKQKESNT